MNDLNNSLRVHEIYDYEYSKTKLWSPFGFFVLSWFFSFLPGAILYAQNSGRVGLKQRKKTLVISSILLFVVTIVMANFLEAEFAKSLFQGVNIGIGIYMWRSQRDMFQDHLDKDGLKASYLIPVIICLVVTGLVIFE